MISDESAVSGRLELLCSADTGQVMRQILQAEGCGR